MRKINRVLLPKQLFEMKSEIFNKEIPYKSKRCLGHSNSIPSSLDFSIPVRGK